jgi:hypothetical protein
VWEGQSGARAYAYSARDVAHGLARVAQGDSYRRAAAHTRAHARRGRGRVDYYRKDGVVRVRRGDKDGQLVANWVDVFAPVVCWPLGHPAWPERMVVDSVSFVVHTGVPRRTLHLFAVVGYDPPRYEPELWLVRPSPAKDQAAWEDFFDLLPGTPSHVIADMDATIELAVDARFPRPRQPRPEYRWSDYHVKKALANVLAPLPPPHPLWKELDQALTSTRRWDAFAAAVDAEHQNGVPLPATLNWFAKYGPRIRQQTIGRLPQQAHSTGSVEAVNHWLKRTLSQRAPHLGNRRRTVKLLDLLTVGYNHQDDEVAFAVAIRKYLEGHHGRPQLAQRELDDLKSAPSLYA